MKKHMEEVEKQVKFRRVAHSLQLRFGVVNIIM